MNIGLAKEVITPDLPIQLSGFAAQRVASDIYDDVYVKVVIVEYRNSYYGVINYDLIGIDHLLMDRLEAKMKEIHLDIRCFMIAATHTHSGSGGVLETNKGILKGTGYILMDPDIGVVEKIVDKTIQALTSTLSTMKEGSIRTAINQLEGIGDNRNDRSFKGNNDIFVIEFSQDQGDKAVVVNYACHPTVLNRDSNKISADFPGAMNQELIDKGYLFSAYLNGSCGDISTRFSRKGSGYDEVKRYGKLLADKVEEMLITAKPTKITNLSIDVITKKLKLKVPETVEEAQRKLEAYKKDIEHAKANGVSGGQLRIVESFYEGAMANLNYAKNAMKDLEYPLPVSIWHINQDAFVTIPGELFSQLSNDLQNEHVHFIGYTNGYIGYFADKHAYDEMYYEALSSPLQKGQPEELMKEIENKLKG